jgi:hypothetical protein
MYKFKNWWHGIFFLTWPMKMVLWILPSIVCCFVFLCIPSTTQAPLFIHKIYHNPNLGLTTKVKARQGVQVKKMFWNLNTSYKCEKVSPNTSKWTHFGIKNFKCFELFLNYETKSCDLHFVAKLKINRVQVIFDII